ncbi:uncharacterized protein LOC134210340 [Armigeres subalbatus]|uniref:uncharacterized protein LOC134210340 n=1 Tax=Armigeres subalbatus TaxID=124917 RepID=UPI002ED51976
MLCKRLHPTTLRQWESYYNSKEVPKYQDLVKFLKSHCSVLQSIAPAKQFHPDLKKPFRPTISHAGIQSNCCPFCGESAHSAFKCIKFSKMRISERLDAVKKHLLCLNCLSSGHFARFCTRGSCFHCGQRHHSLLHANSSTIANPSAKSGQSNGNLSSRKSPGQQPLQVKPTQIGHSTHTQHTQAGRTEQLNSTHASNAHSQLSATDGPSTSLHTAPLATTKHVPHTVLLSTAVVSLYDQFGNSLLARALLDSGSQRCYMSETVSQRLKFKRTREHLPIVGIGGSRTASTQAVFAEVHSLATNYVANLKFHVLPRVTVDLPTRSIDICSWNVPKEIVLADPTFHESAAVDLIIGAEVYLELIIAERQMKLGDSGPILQNTLLGWIVSGGIPDESAVLPVVSSCAAENIEEGLARFFELESCRTSSTLSLEESACETHFERTTTRDSTGRFVVQLPKKQFLVDRLGDTQAIATRRFMALERRLDTDPFVKKMYSDFINEYLRMQHMIEISARDLSTVPVAYFLPHHAVLKPDSTTTKLRVVFDASCASTSGVSLNEALMVGPVVQDDLTSITLRFRLRKYAMTADIEKMYRMIKMHPMDHPLQCIVWREDSSKPIRMFMLTTVTYGTSSAPYLATRCLKKLAEDEKNNFPAATDTILYEFYVDDMLKSVDSLEEAVQLSQDLIEVLSTAGLTLRKWSSNSRELLDHIPPYLRDERSCLDLELSNPTVKTLGIKWEPRSDIFRFTVPQWNPATEITKRIILSDFAKLFDPLGLVGPSLVPAKVFLQDLWRTKCSWNDILPEELQVWWRGFRESLEGLTLLQVPRWIAFGSETLSVELHMFCDASQKAYGACIYLRCVSFDGTVSSSLVTAKSRVAPLEDLEKKRKQISIPRLELSSALTGAHLYEKVVQSLKIAVQPYFWTDSMIVKCWIAAPPSRWNIFVANRVSEIQHITRGGIWNHIAGLDNPANVLSRGMDPHQLKDFQMWWQGPPWLQLDKTLWPTSANINHEDLDPLLLEERTTVSAPAQVIEPSTIFSLRSSLQDLVRIVSLIRRFVHNCRNTSDRRVGLVRLEEREAALHQLLILAQRESFPEELVALRKNGEVKPTSRLKQLCPRLVNGLILVGGRLRNANISAGRKHPIVLDNQHPLSILLADYYHKKALHAGQQLLIASMRERYWPIAARSLARKVIHRCIKCFRARPKSSEQLMADLPAERVNPAPPFLRVGVDYCGPFYIQNPYRKGGSIKCFVAVFVCLVVKAVHLEVVGDLTTQAFVAALRRFVSRRGSNFVGARRELDDLRKLFNNQMFVKAVTEEASLENINFKFIPAKSPNFGGLWEAAVKSMKGHLKRTLGNTVLVADEMVTLVAQIEACLNSRPVTPLSNDADDLDFLTPGHFLVGRPLTAIPEPSLQELNQSRLSRWQRVQYFLQHIWKRWSTQYLSSLHARTKWSRLRNNILVGTMVLLREDNLPPLRWRMGRVSEIHPGKDGNIRVVKVRTKDGDFPKYVSYQFSTTTLHPRQLTRRINSFFIRRLVALRRPSGLRVPVKFLFYNI